MDLPTFETLEALPFGAICPETRCKLVRVWWLEPGSMTIRQRTRDVPKTGRTFDVIASHPWYRKSAERLVTLSIAEPDFARDPGRGGLIEQARLRVREVTSGPGTD